VPSAREPEAIYRVFGRRLRELREKKGVAQEELATLSGLTRSSIANIESGKQRVLLHQLLRFAQTLRVNLAELVPATLEVPEILSTQTAHAMDDYAERLLRMASGQTDQENR
jgi:transcriptional regulator with XRE-family HTH domain